MASTELKILITGILFMFFLNTGLSFVLDNSQYENYDRNQVLDELRDSSNEELPVVDGSPESWLDYVLTGTGNVLNGAGNILLDLIYSLAGTFFSIFGVDFIGVIYVLPQWLSSLILLYNGIIITSAAYYLYKIFWIG